MIRPNRVVYMGAALLLAACADEYQPAAETKAGTDRLPLRLEATLGNGTAAATRAAGNKFETGDILLAYLVHTTGVKVSSPIEWYDYYTTTSADQAPKLVAFKKGSTAMTGDGTLSTSDLSSVLTSDNTTAAPLYWDDFSNSAATTTDLRTSGHGLQSFYGYCYNGGTPTTALTESTGELGWTVPTSYANETAIKTADLLWSSAQETVTYAHASAQSGAHGTLTIPYTHAMSQVTVTVTTGLGFEGIDAPLASTSLTLNAMNTVATLTAPSGTATSGTPANITMYGETYTSGSTRTFTAIVAPGTKLKEGVKLLDIANVHDNNYTLAVTSSMLENAQWGTKLTEKTDDDTYYETQPGINYHLTVTITKTEITTQASIQDWTPVNATGTAVIQYPNNIVIDVTGETFTDNSTFSLFQLAHSTSSDEASERTNAAYSFVTVPKYSTSSSEWTNTPAIYWPDASTKYYFRALATQTSDHNIASIGTVEPAVATSFNVAQGGSDILWGTTSAHNTHAGEPPTYDYDEGAAIDPRTSNVPIQFEHALSKVTFILETTSDATVTVNNQKVELTAPPTPPAETPVATAIAISNLYTGGTISIETGDITPTGDRTSAAISGTVTSVTTVPDVKTTAPTTIANLSVVPQVITDASFITITLADGTTYKLRLNLCKDNTQTVIGAWERGKHYTYTIHIEKEQITFRALIKDWDVKNGSGNANLEWD